MARETAELLTLICTCGAVALDGPGVVVEQSIRCVSASKS